MSGVMFKQTRLETRAQHVVWVGLKAGEAGAPFSLHGGPDRSVQVTGNFSGGATLYWEGSNNVFEQSPDWFTLTDPQGNPLSFATARLEQVTEYTRWVRPRVAAGDANTSLTVNLFLGM
jgi:hypothetical protein